VVHARNLPVIIIWRTGKDYAETGVTCNAVAPAVVRTAMVDAMPEQQVRWHSHTVYQS
jgi:NAD(P)-dependent dehydrogenase (short-subunit alcohol dehydrogenase family)